MKKDIIPAINLHLTKSCNMKCGYCFAKFNDTEQLFPFNETKELILLLRKFGFDKINFVGGEPMLIPKIGELLKISKEIGFYTSIVTNGSLLTKEFLEHSHTYIDMIGLSVDSIISGTNNLIGRKAKNASMDSSSYFRIIELIKVYDINLKINTVVSNLNKEEILTKFINYAKPMRWKIFQVLKVDGENNTNFDKYKISKSEFDNYCVKQLNSLEFPKILIEESDEIMRGSYLMINPEGQFFDNTRGHYKVSDSILTNGVEKSLSQIEFDYSKFKNRDGNYYKNYKKITA